MGLSPHSGSRDRSDPDVAIKAYKTRFDYFLKLLRLCASTQIMCILG